MTNCVMAVDDSPLTLKLISGMLRSGGHKVVTFASGAEALAQIEAVRPDLIILDVMMPEMDGYEVCRRLRQEHLTAHLPIVMLTAMDSLEHKIKGFEAGADDYMLKPFQAGELQARVEALLRRSSDVPASVGGLAAKAIAVFSMRGGVGVSTLAANLAVGLAQIWEVPTVLVDLSLTAGQTALMLNLSLRHTWANLASIDIEELDASLLDEVLLDHPSGARVLAAPRRPEESDLVSAELIARTIDLLSEHYHYLVFDLPHNLQDTTLVGLDASHQILTLMAPEIASVRAMAATLEVFDLLDYPKSKTSLVLNNTFPDSSAKASKGYSLCREDIETTLRRQIELEIPYVPDLFVPAVNAGVPPVFDAPNTQVGSLLEDYAFQVSKKEHQEMELESLGVARRRVAHRGKKRP